jgi:hypothetical protein
VLFLVRIRKGAQPLLVLGALTLGGIGYVISRSPAPDVVVLFDAPPIDTPPPVDTPPDVPPDTPPPDAPTDWTLVTIYGPEGTVGLDGADGVDTTTIGGNLCIVTPWEQSNRVSVSCKVGSAWTTTVLAGSVSAVEDAKFCDINGDAHPDVVAAGQSKRMSWWAGTGVSNPPGFGAMIPIDAAFAGTNAWIQVECTAGRIWAGGRNVPATVGYFDIPVDPTDSGAWTYTSVGPVGWTMSLIPYDMDGDTDLDLVISDRLNDAPTSDLGSRWLENDGSPPWPSNRIHKHISEGSPKFMHVISATSVIDTSSSTTQNRSAFRNWNGSAWVTTAVTQPAGVGQVHDVEPCDLDGDAVDDLVFSYSTATGDAIGVAALLGPGYTTLVDIDKAAGEKYDNVLCVDLDGDGDLDVLTSEQNTGLGLVYFRNPETP